MAVAEFIAQYRKEGVLFIAVCPGAVDSGYFDNRKSFFFSKCSC